MPQLASVASYTIDANCGTYNRRVVIATMSSKNSKFKLQDYAIPTDEDPLNDDVKKKLEVRGFYQDEQGKIRLNANIFVDYVLKRLRLLYNNSLFHIYHISRGQWIDITEHELLILTREIIHEAQENLYHSSFSREYMQVLKLETPQVDRLNPNKHLINLKNGMLDMVTKELLPHSPEYYSTVQIDLNYVPKFIAPRFIRFVEEITQGDTSLMALLQEILGYILSAETCIQKAFFFVGTGSNGKGVLTRLITLLVGGQNVSNLSLKDLGNPFRLANLVGKTVNIAAENEVGQRGFQSEIFKQLIGGMTLRLNESMRIHSAILRHLNLSLLSIRCLLPMIAHMGSTEGSSYFLLAENLRMTSRILNLLMN
ncbi:hypothetical protein B9T62_31700 [Paenibacillus donghaensis]|uniref:SF3 helicase domain-containing protein n=2 Tax=Paenibacillus donghaensis TaxID=414771 RepID=A0A2Z2KMY1_9BACL|nr:hypothetical protein B9T62_31700 [Paenibacillus donghaensis]